MPKHNVQITATDDKSLVIFVALYAKAYNEEQIYRRKHGLGILPLIKINEDGDAILEGFRDGRDNQLNLIAYLDDKPVGIINCILKSNYIANHYVLPEHRKTGIGTQLLTTLIARLNELNPERPQSYRMGILASDTDGAKFYEQRGFVAPQVNLYTLTTTK